MAIHAVRYVCTSCEIKDQLDSIKRMVTQPDVKRDIKENLKTLLDISIVSWDGKSRRKTAKTC